MHILSLCTFLFSSPSWQVAFEEGKKKKTKKELKNKQAKDLGLMESLIGTALKLNS